MEERFQTELRCRRRRKGESLRELAQDIRRLMSLAYPGEKSGLAEHIARDAFLIALEDPEFELKIREREPADLDTALKIAQRYEVSRGLVDASSGIRHRVTRQVVEDDNSSVLSATDLEARVAAVERQLQSTSSTAGTKPLQQKFEPSKKTGESIRGKRSDQKQSRAVNNEEREWKGQLLQKIKDLESAQTAGRDQVADLVKENEALNKELSWLKQFSSPSQNVQMPVEQASAGPSAQAAVAYPMYNPRPYGVCWTCGEAGHFARDHFRGQQPALPVQQPAPQQYAPTSGSRVANVTTNSGVVKGGATYLRAYVNGREQNCLLDTGSEVSLLPADLIPRELLRPTTQSLRAANGTEIGVQGLATVPFSTKSFATTVTGLVSDHIAEVMLGVDWLAENNVIWDFRYAQIRLGGRVHGLHHQRRGKNWCRRVVVQQDTEIPARSQKMFLARSYFVVARRTRMIYNGARNR